MLNATQIKADFEKLRSADHEHGQIVTLGHDGETCRALKSQQTKTVRIHDYGEDEGDMFSLRFLIDDFTIVPREKDVVTVDGVEYEVGEVRYSGLGQIIRIFCMDSD